MYFRALLVDKCWYVVSPSLMSCSIVLLIEAKNWHFLLLSKGRS